MSTNKIGTFREWLREREENILENINKSKNFEKYDEGQIDNINNFFNTEHKLSDNLTIMESTSNKPKMLFKGMLSDLDKFKNKKIVKSGKLKQAVLDTIEFAKSGLFGKIIENPFYVENASFKTDKWSIFYER